MTVTAQPSLGPSWSLSASHSKVSVNELTPLACWIAALSNESDEMHTPGCQADLVQVLQLGCDFTEQPAL